MSVHCYFSTWAVLKYTLPAFLEKIEKGKIRKPTRSSLKLPGHMVHISKYTARVLTMYSGTDNYSPWATVTVPSADSTVLCFQTVKERRAVLRTGHQTRKHSGEGESEGHPPTPHPFFFL